MFLSLQNIKYLVNAVFNILIFLYKYLIHNYLLYLRLISKQIIAIYIYFFITVANLSNKFLYSHISTN
jgi:hypothetical protein